jgi:alkanesulfonate monooxygenase SsuD/methylene tetrahydromethanopterin reductase-like flavin-dependent oxidoreductase (luciferase family)
MSQAQPVLDRALAVATRHLPAPARRHRAALRPLPPALPAETPTLPAPAPTPVAATPAPPAVPEPTIHVLAPDYGVRTVESRPGSESAIALAGVHADVVRLEFSVAVPSVGALSRVAALVDDAVAASGRDRADVRVLLDLEVVVAVDEVTARRKRSQLEYLDALAGLSWSPAATRVVTTGDRLVAEVRELARRAGVDGVVLHPLSGGPAAAADLRSLVA